MIWLIVFAVLLLADVWTTVQAFKHGGGEGNDFVRWCMDRVGVYPALLGLSALIMAGMYVAYLTEPIVLAPAIVWRASVVYHNLKVLKILKERV